MVSVKDNYPNRSLLFPILAVAIAVVAGVSVTFALNNHFSAQTWTGLTDRWAAGHHRSVALLATSAGTLTPSSATALLIPALPQELSLRIFTLEQHSKQPWLLLNPGIDGSSEHSLRSEVTFNEQRWIVTTAPDWQALNRAVNRTHQVVWASGLGLTFIATFFAFVCVCRTRRHEKAASEKQEEVKGLSQKVSNLMTEKTILRQATFDSEQRSRDLIALSGCAMCEADENGRIGYLSDQALELFGVAPGDLIDHTVASLIADADQENFQRALEAARSEQRIQRIDLHLKHRALGQIPATIRMLVLHDTLHGFCGFRLSLQARSSN